VNRLCASGLDAIAGAARAIALGECAIALAGGVESMSRAPYVMGKAPQAFARGQKLEDTTLGWRFVNPRFEAAHGVDSMAETAEHVARAHRRRARDQDAYALRSQLARRRARTAEGRFELEITPCALPSRAPTPSRARATTAEARHDAGPARGPQTHHGARTARLPRATPRASTTARAAVLLASRATVDRHGLAPLARVLGFAASGVEPRVMGIGPISASGSCSPVWTRARARGPDRAERGVRRPGAGGAPGPGPAGRRGHVNPNGGAIALGHPLGASGARLAATAAFELQRRQARSPCATMCVVWGRGVGWRWSASSEVVRHIRNRSLGLEKLGLVFNSANSFRAIGLQLQPAPIMSPSLSRSAPRIKPYTSLAGWNTMRALRRPGRARAAARTAR
jgi:acetyl-CoA acetyltransferase